MAAHDDLYKHSIKRLGIGVAVGAVLTCCASGEPRVQPVIFVVLSLIVFDAVFFMGMGLSQVSYMYM